MTVQEILSILFIIVLIVAPFAYKYFTKKKNMVLIDNGEDMGRIKTAIAGVLPGGTDYEVLYAHHEELAAVSTNLRRTAYRYYHYAVAFDDTCLWVIPLQVNPSGTIVTKPPLMFTKDNVGAVTATPTQTKGELSSIRCHIQDKELKNTFMMDLDVINYREDTDHYFNIRQMEECKKFYDFIVAFVQQVDAAR